MKNWEGENEIKAQLRELTERTRQLRHDLDALVRPAAPNPTRAFIHPQEWPKPEPAAAAEGSVHANKAAMPAPPPAGKKHTANDLLLSARRRLKDLRNPVRPLG